MKRAKDPLTAATTSYLWPFIKNQGFTKVTSRRFAREQNDIIQQLIVDANGFNGKASTYIILYSTFVFSHIDGYNDLAGFRICEGKSWDMSTHDNADKNMMKVIDALEKTEIKKLEKSNTIDNLLNTIKPFWDKKRLKQYSSQVSKWYSQDKTLLDQALSNRQELKLELKS